MPPRKGAIRFGIFEVDLEAGELRRKGVRVKLQEQPFQVLAALLERPGEVVTKEQLQERIWTEDTFVDYDRSLATAVNKVRQALGDSATGSRFVETIPKRGYRFVAPVDSSQGEESAPAVPIQAGGGRNALALLAGLALASFGVAAWRSMSEPEPVPLTAVPLTSLPGNEFVPALSPDGSRVAFSWNSDGDNYDIYVKTIGDDDAPARLTFAPENDSSPTWSPDGSYIAFVRGGSEFEVLRIPSIGGPEKSLTRSSSPWWFESATSHSRFLDWSPNGEYIAVVDRAENGAAALFQLHVDRGERIPIPVTGGAVISPAYSPDGRRLAFVRNNGVGIGDVWVQGLGADGGAVGDPRRMTDHQTGVYGLDWSPDGAHIVFASAFDGPQRIWRVRADGGEPQLVPVNAESASYVSISPGSARMVVDQERAESDLWRLSGPAAAEYEQPRPIIASTRGDHSAHFSPDGRRLVYVSSRTGSRELWTSSSDGSDEKRITSLGGPNLGSPRWSYDGRFIAFDCNRDGNWDIYVVRADGGDVRQVTASPSMDVRPGWSRDGAWIYFSSSRSGDLNIWKAPAAGGEPIQVTRDGGVEPFEAGDGSLYFNRDLYGPGEVWRLPPSGRDPRLILTGVKAQFWTWFEAGVCSATFGESSVSCYDFQTKQWSEVGRLPQGATIGGGSPMLTISPDGTALVAATRRSLGSDLLLVEGLR